MKNFTSEINLNKQNTYSTEKEWENVINRYSENTKTKNKNKIIYKERDKDNNKNIEKEKIM
jgi:hypothetical protein